MATDRPARLAYADPPYVGLAERYYGDHPDYAGEVDHLELLRALSGFDGWALSCSSASVPLIGSMVTQLQLPARLAVWVRHPPPHPTARIVTAYEGVWYVPARLERSREDLRDVFAEKPGARPLPTVPSAVVGMKPTAMLSWVFELIGARPGDELADLFPGSGIVSAAWRAWSGDPARAPADVTLWHAGALTGR